jgi:hypothetical protein
MSDKPSGHDHHGHTHGHTHGHAHGDHAGPHHTAGHGHAHAPPVSTRSLLMASSAQRVLGALGLIALLWMAVAWAVLSGD